MTGKEKIEAEEKKYHRYVSVGHKCEECDEFMFYEQASLAHRIPKTKSNLKKYGPEIIHHPLNMKLVCSLKCNSAVLLSPACHPLEAAALVEKIKKEIEK